MANNKESDILVSVGADLSNLNNQLKELEKSKAKSIKLAVSGDSSQLGKFDKAIDETKKKIDKLSKAISDLHIKSAKAAIESLSVQDRIEIQKFKNKELRIKLEIQQEKNKYKEIEGANKIHLESMEARHKKSLEKLKTLNKMQINEQVSNLRILELNQKASNANILAEIKSNNAKKINEHKEYAKTALGALTEGTSFGHKLVTTSMYAAAGSILYGISGAFSSLKDSIIEADKYLSMFQGVLELNSNQAKKLQEDIFNVGKTFGGTTQGLSEAALMLGRAGIAGQDLANGLKVASQAALISGDNIENITEMLASWKTVYPEESITHLGDMMAKIANESLLSIDGLKTATSYITAAGQAAGVSADQLIELAGAWKQTGKADSIVGTEIRRLFNQIEGASDDVRKVYWAMGIDLNKVNEGLKSSSKETREATFRSFMQMIGDSDKWSESKKKNVQKVKDSMAEVLDKQTINSALVAGREFAKMEEAGNHASGSLEKSSEKIALSYEKMWERIKIAGVEASTKFEEGFKKGFASSAVTTEEFNKKVNELSDTFNNVAKNIGIVSGTIVESLDKIAIAASIMYIGGKIDTGIAAIRIGMLSQVPVIETLKSAWYKLNLVMNSNPYFAAATLAVGVWSVSDMVADVIDGEKRLKEGSKTLNSYIDNEKNKLYQKSIDDVNRYALAYENLSKAADKANGKTKQYLLKQAEIVKSKRDELASKFYVKPNDVSNGKVDLSANGNLSLSGDDKEARKAQRIAQDALDEEISKIRIKYSEIEKNEARLGKVTELRKKELESLEAKEIKLATIKHDKIDEYSKKVNNATVAENDKLRDQYALIYKINFENDRKASIANSQAKIEKARTEEEKISAEYSKKYNEINWQYLNNEIDAKQKLALIGVADEEKQKKLTDLAEKRNEEYQKGLLTVQQESSAYTDYLNNIIGLSSARNQLEAQRADIANKISSLELDAANKLKDVSNEEDKKKINDVLQHRTDILKEQLSVIEAMSDIDINIEGIDKLNDMFSGMSDNFARQAKSIMTLGSNIAKRQLDNDRKVYASNSKLHKAFIDAKGDEKKEQEALSVYEQEQSKIREISMDDYVGAFSDLTNVVKAYGEQSSTAAKIAEGSEKALAVVQAIRAVIRAWGDPFPLNLVTVPATVAATGALLSQIGATSGAGSSSGGYSSFSKSDMIEKQYNPIIDRLDKQIELLDSIDKNGSAQALSVNKSRQEYERDLRLLIEESFKSVAKGGTLDKTIKYDQAVALNSALGFNAYNLKDKGFSLDSLVGAVANSMTIGLESALTSSELSKKFKGVINKSALRDLESFISFASEASKSLDYFAGKKEYERQISRDTFITNVQEVISDFALSMVDSVNELSDAKSTMESVFDSITGTLTYSTKNIGKAFSAVEELKGPQELDEYLRDTINMISEVEDVMGGSIQSLLDGSVSNFEDQTAAVLMLQDKLGIVFESGAADALDFIDAIEQVGDVLSTGFQEYVDNFASEQDKVIYAMKSINKEFKSLGLEAPRTADDFRDLVISTREAGDGSSALYGSLMSLTGAFASASSSMSALMSKYDSAIYQLQTTLDPSSYRTLDYYASDVANVTIDTFEQVFSNITEARDAQLASLQKAVDDAQNAITNTQNEYATKQNDLKKAYEDSIKPIQENIDSLKKEKDTRIKAINDSKDATMKLYNELLKFAPVMDKINEILTPNNTTLAQYADILSSIDVDNASKYISDLEKARDDEIAVIEQNRDTQLTVLESQLEVAQKFMDVYDSLNDLSKSIRDTAFGSDAGYAKSNFKSLYSTIQASLLAGEDVSSYMQDFSNYSNMYADVIKSQASTYADFAYETLLLSNQISDLNVSNTGKTDFEILTNEIQALNAQTEASLATVNDTFKSMISYLNTSLSSSLKAAEEAAGISYKQVEYAIAELTKITESQLDVVNTTFDKQLEVLNATMEALAEKFKQDSEAIARELDRALEPLTDELKNAQRIQKEQADIVNKQYLEYIAQMKVALEQQQKDLKELSQSELFNRYLGSSSPVVSAINNLADKQQMSLSDKLKEAVSAGFGDKLSGKEMLGFGFTQNEIDLLTNANKNLGQGGAISLTDTTALIDVIESGTTTPDVSVTVIPSETITQPTAVDTTVPTAVDTTVPTAVQSLSDRLKGASITSKITANNAASFGISTYQLSQMQQINKQIGQGNTIDPKDISKLLDEMALRGYSSGGYTGDIAENAVAGIVHGKEYVVNAKTTKDLGLNNSSGVFNDIMDTLIDIKNLTVKLVADNSKQLNTQRAIYAQGVA